MPAKILLWGLVINVIFWGLVTFIIDWLTKFKFINWIEKSKYVFIAAGAQLSAKINLEGIDSEGIIEPLEFLFRVRDNKEPGIGKNVAIIGGGNTAMDAARTAYRLVGKEGKGIRES